MAYGFCCVQSRASNAWPNIAGVPLVARGADAVAVALRIGRGTLRKMRQNLAWAIGYNAIALPIAAGVFEPAFGLVLRPEIAALTMSGSRVLVAVNALLPKRLSLREPAEQSGTEPADGRNQELRPAT